jgi:hypothetical protein
VLIAALVAVFVANRLIASLATTVSASDLAIVLTTAAILGATVPTSRLLVAARTTTVTAAAATAMDHHGLRVLTFLDLVDGDLREEKPCACVKQSGERSPTDDLSLHVVFFADTFDLDLRIVVFEAFFPRDRGLSNRPEVL